MKRKRKKPRRAGQASPQKTAKPFPEEGRLTKRRNWSRLRAWALLSVVLIAGLWYLATTVTAGLAEHDLSRIGNGIPAVVQVHDPRCSSCVALQKQAREAMQEFTSEELQYLIADINNPGGRRLAATHGVGNVTLLLFDGKGTRRSVLAGPNSSEILTHYFRAHRDRYGVNR